MAAVRRCAWRLGARYNAGVRWEQERAGRITHEAQSLQAREVAEGPRWDARELVAALLKDGKGVESEADVDTAHGRVKVPR